VPGVQMDGEFMYREGKNFHNYTSHYQLFEITLRFSLNSNSGVLNDRVRFPACPRWERFADEDLEKISLNTQPEKYTDE